MKFIFLSFNSDSFPNSSVFILSSVRIQHERYLPSVGYLHIKCTVRYKIRIIHILILFGLPFVWLLRSYTYAYTDYIIVHAWFISVIMCDIKYHSVNERNQPKYTFWLL